MKNLTKDISKRVVRATDYDYLNRPETDIWGQVEAQVSYPIERTSIVL